MNSLLNVSASPHARSEHDTFHEMYNVILALIPVTVFGIWHFGLHSLIVVCMSIISAMGTEFVFNNITHRPNTLRDGSAIVTGLLLALVLPPTVPLFIPFIGSLFAILFVKCFFGGLGQNFMNPALAGRAFLLISFGTLMTKYSVDGTSSATPLAAFNGGSSVSVMKMFLGFVDGHIGISVICLLIGGAYLLFTGTITWQIPVSTLVSFVILMAVFGGHGFSVNYLLTEVCGGGIVLGAFFMATDPVTSPMAPLGQILYGCMVGLLSMMFRCYSNMADGTTYAIIIANLLVPSLDRLIIPEPFGIGKKELLVEGIQEKKHGISVPKSALVLMIIAIATGGALALVNAVTAPKIAENALAANLASYQTVLPDAAEFEYDDNITSLFEELQANGNYKDGAFGKIVINEVVVGKDASGNSVGQAISVSTMEGFEGEIKLTVGILNDGTVNEIAFTELAETAGMGMRVDEPGWKAQFAGKNVESFKLLKGGGASADDEIDSVSGASTTSGAVVNAVNAAIDLFAESNAA
ncbi:MAG: RnfABCDGE type electron transport complex subunit D [Blautia sp.]|nr:RnfABCDGE type electron transport complex subunit D [Blautia sp.]